MASIFMLFLLGFSGTFGEAVLSDSLPVVLSGAFSVVTLSVVVSVLESLTGGVGLQEKRNITVGISNIKI